MKETHEGIEKLILLDKFLTDGQSVSISKLPGGFVIL